ncbi:SDR family NAD(P)-dependent oxidoreductase [Pleurocapsales cyanobacterium LEGE 10410]|nr:SDR family NAD(P)-dependent oxidoreductase [Pleurocapsales cyanobacterium LEGE 10410]
MTHLNQNTVCLVSGGGRGITAQAAIALSRQYQCKFILLGRSSISNPEPKWARDCNDEMKLKKRILEYLLQQDEKPTPKMVQREYRSIAAKQEIEQTLDWISQAGGQAEYLSVDVTDKDAVALGISTVESKLGKVTAIVHGAGNLADKPIEKKSERDFDLVYAPKVRGLANLLACIDPSQLDCLVLFSSVVGFYGNAGQTDYAIANDILNKTAYTILSATCAISWIANTCEQIYPGYAFSTCSNFKVLKGIVFDDALADKYVLDLEKKAANNSLDINFNAKIWSKDKSGKIRYHFNTKLKLTSQKNNTSQCNSLDLSRSSNAFTQPESIYKKGKNSLYSLEEVVDRLILG